jgi:serine protease
MRGFVARLFLPCAGLLLCVLVAAAGAADLDDTIVVKINPNAQQGSAIPPVIADLLRSAVGSDYTVVESTRDGAVKLKLPAPLSLDRLRSVLNPIRDHPAIIYASSSQRASLGTKSLTVGRADGVNDRPVSRLIVRYRDHVSSASLPGNRRTAALRLGRIEAIAGTAVAHERYTSRGEQLVRFVAPVTPTRAALIAQALEQDVDVEYADPDYWVYAALTPNDPSFNSAAGQWHLKSPVSEPGGANLPGAWDRTTGSPTIVVAVIDSGILFGHPDLSGRILNGIDLITSVDSNDGDSRDLDPSDPGDWRYAGKCGPGDPAQDSSWHGSHVAGTIGAASNNGMHGAGINWNSKILPVRVLGRCDGTVADINDAIVWSAGGSVVGAPNTSTPAKVLNLSIGGGGQCGASTQNAINGAIGAGAVVVVAAGNENENASFHWLSSCNGAITVGANQRQGFKSEYSNFGTAVEITAPGGGYDYPSGQWNGIWSTVNASTTSPIGGSGYIIDTMQGTSQATPHVAGVASLMLSVDPSLTPAQILSRIQSTARPFPTGGPTCDTVSNPRPPNSAWYSCQCTTAICGAGIIDAAAAVAAAVPPAPSMPGIGTVVSNPYGTLSVIGGTLIGTSISALQPGAVIQLGGIAGTAGSYLAIDFQGFNVGAGKSLTIRSGALGQHVYLYNADTSTSTVSGIVQTQNNGASPAPTLYLQNPNGITVSSSGAVVGPTGLVVDTLGSSWTIGKNLVNQGLIDGGNYLDLYSARITGGGAFKGNDFFLGTFGNINNPTNGAYFLDNGLQLYPSSGASVGLTLSAYGTAPQVMNLKVNGSANVWMPSAWPAGTTAPTNNGTVQPGYMLPTGTLFPAFGGGSMIIQVSGALSLYSGPTNDFVFPGGIVFKSAGTLDVNGVVVNNGWTGSGQSFQGVFFESPNIVSSVGNFSVFTNNLNWINFSTFPHAPVRSSQLAPFTGGLSYKVSDSVAPHINTYSTLINTVTLPGFDVHQNFDNVLMNGEGNGEGISTKSAVHRRVQA